MLRTKFFLVALTLPCGPALCQNYTVHAVAGGDLPVEGPGLRVPMSPIDITAGPDGSFFVSDQGRARIWQIGSDSAVRSIAGTGVSGSSGDGGPAANAAVAPLALAYDSARRILYFSQPAFGTVRAIDTRTGVISTVAGNGSRQWLAGNEGKPAREVPMTPQWIAVDESGNLYISDLLNYRIYRVDASSRTFLTIAGTGPSEINPFNPQRDGKQARTVPVWPEYIAASNNYVLFADYLNMGRIDLRTGAYQTFVRNWRNTGEGAENGGGTLLSKPVFRGGTVLLADWLFWNVYSLDPGATIELNQPVEVIRFERENMPLHDFGRTGGSNLVNFAADGSTLMTFTADRVLRGSGKQLTPVAGAASHLRTMRAAEASLDVPFGLALNPRGELIVAETRGYVRIVNPDREEVRIPSVKLPPWELFPAVGDQVEPIAYFVREDHPDELFPLSPLLSVAVDRTGRICYSTGGGTIGFIAAGEGDFGFLRTGPTLRDVTGMAALPDDTFVVADWGMNAVRQVSASGHSVRTLAGNGTEVFVPGAAPTSTGIVPFDVAVAPSGIIYILDRDYSRVYALDREVNQIRIFAGTGEPGFSGDGGPADSARFRFPQGIAAGPAGDVFIADSGNRRIRRIGSDGIIQTIAGNGEEGSTGNGGPAVGAAMVPSRLVVAADGTVYFSDARARRIRRLVPSVVQP